MAKMVFACAPTVCPPVQMIARYLVAGCRLQVHWRSMLLYGIVGMGISRASV